MSPAELVRPCIGCGRRPVRGRRYCRVCRSRLANGRPIDLDEWPTFRDSRRALAPEPVDGQFNEPRRRGLAAMRAGR